VCVDAQDHVFVLSRGDLWPKEAAIATPAPPVIEFDTDGKVVNSWGDRATMPKQLHGCSIDYQGNIWIAGRFDGIVQKYTHDGSRMLLQIAFGCAVAPLVPQFGQRCPTTVLLLQNPIPGPYVADAGCIRMTMLRILNVAGRSTGDVAGD
jgi:hypothetical protein